MYINLHMIYMSYIQLLTFTCTTMVNTLMGLNVIIPLLEVVHSLIKLVELCMCDFIATIKICERDVYWMYCDIHSSFQYFFNQW